jgi:hypothetical protein
VSLVAGTFRGVWRRAGVSLGILLVAAVASAAAAAGPAYDAAARASILQDNLHDQPPSRGPWRLTAAGRWPASPTA